MAGAASLGSNALACASGRLEPSEEVVEPNRGTIYELLIVSPVVNY